ncbi:GH18 domain-containing protein [Fusarium keratoplasticum]|uniref:GH18 domain-containing protein n=1 Tax=Fusarium keratoplasticum TaxID=1328300 RepID=A0ACC0QD17_9HYPO|nr:GH18 domain-containing protein [Fusarium keratoplasticum]KAI8649295.1 GH18 domain-containing protein [Fusarium keratoplasticum]
MGFHGLMIWAIKLNVLNLEALRAVYKGELIGHTQDPFSLINYALINFRGNADAGD